MHREFYLLEGLLLIVCSLLHCLGGVTSYRPLFEHAQVGEEEFIRQASIVKQHGAAVVVMAFDEMGQVCNIFFSRALACEPSSFCLERVF
jgi:hypothetical protein